MSHAFAPAATPSPRRPPLAPLVAAVVDELANRAVGDRRASIQNGAVAHVPRALVVVGEARAARAHLERAAGHQHHVAPRPAARRGDLAARGGVVRLGGHELQRLEDRLGVLLLVAQDHLVDEAVGEQRPAGVATGRAVEQVERALAHRLHVGAELSLRR